MTTLPAPMFDPAPDADVAPATIVLAGGCFWCVEAVFLPLAGVLGVRSGYAGGTADTANYQTVCSGTTDHAEAVEVRYDPATISLGRLLQVFFEVAHDPTQLNRQGHDRGRQYRSAIFYRTPAEKAVADAYIRQLDTAQVFAASIATTLEPLEAFYEAEGYHQNYAARNPAQPYVLFTALPKVEKLRESYGTLLRPTSPKA
ncbi:MAG TPA: peptide-methionine (S)-S-oxide reductase MsrA [Vicinamibacterales bacterium]|nr:peptide-methionine (S)-S-oxide reductase MsrA [Vicinamibacterales bacterium]